LPALSTYRKSRSFAILKTSLSILMSCLFFSVTAVPIQDYFFGHNFLNASE
jgi:hypothetical protein